MRPRARKIFRFKSAFIKYFIEQEAILRFVRRMTDDDTPILNAFAKVLRRRRTQAGLSQEELAHRAGLSMRYVSLLEGRKHQPSLGTLDALAQSLGVSLTDFIAQVDEEARSGAD